ncbi:hypothetical protein LC2W_2986 [Lacticaseibacillus paracasei]|nr:hypothetical protein LC2W_2986 [Lacticaseibacillus paracasei]AEA58490.1 Hypothetical cytosolic protein [Lacticaseibacillus paracasei]CAD7482525.1 conserved hypothetical protein [Lacticaseibacillus paracasei]
MATALGGGVTVIDFLNQIIAPLIVGVVLLLLEHRLNDRR